MLKVKVNGFEMYYEVQGDARARYVVGSSVCEKIQ